MTTVAAPGNSRTGSSRRGSCSVRSSRNGAHLAGRLARRCSPRSETSTRVPPGLVHLGGRRVVGPEQPERHEEDVQQAGVVRVLDVLEHQLPVRREHAGAGSRARSSVAAVEDAVEPAEHRRAEVVVERRRRAERGEHHAVALASPASDTRPWSASSKSSGIPPILCPPDPVTPLRNGAATRLPARSYDPLVVRAHQLVGVPARRTAERDAAMRAPVEEHAHGAIGWRTTTTGCSPIQVEMKSPGCATSQAERDVAPERAAEDAPLLALVELGVGVHPVRDASDAFVGPRTHARSLSPGCHSTRLSPAGEGRSTTNSVRCAGNTCSLISTGVAVDVAA